MSVQTLTAATPDGRQAIEAVMVASYRGDIDDVPHRDRSQRSDALAHNLEAAVL